MKFTHVIGIIIIIAVIIIGALILMGYINIPSLNIGGNGNTLPKPSDSNCGYSDRDMYLAMEGITGKDLSYTQFQSYTDTLNMEMCHHDTLNYAQVITFYKNQFENDGYTHVADRTLNSIGWTAIVTYYISDDDTDIKSCIAGGGSAVTVAFGHNTMFMTANGPATSWLEFYRWITT